MKPDFKYLFIAVGFGTAGTLLYWMGATLSDTKSGDAAVFPANVTQVADQDELHENSTPVLNGPASIHPTNIFPNDKNTQLTDTFREQLNTIVSSPIEEYSRRHAAVQALDYHLHDIEIEMLYDFLKAPPPDGDMERNQDRALKNDIINRLRTQREPPEGLTAVLVAVFENFEQDITVRDYALQQMRAHYSTVSIKDRMRIKHVLAKALNETRANISGTALLAHWELVNSSEGVADNSTIGKEVAKAAQEILSSEEASELSRITALQILAETAPEQIVETAVQWALDSGISYPCRISAIAALGRTGTKEARDVLLQLDGLNDVYLRPSIELAQRNLTKFEKLHSFEEYR